MEYLKWVMPRGAHAPLFLSVTRKYILHRNTPFPVVGHIYMKLRHTYIQHTLYMGHAANFKD